MITQKILLYSFFLLYRLSYIVATTVNGKVHPSRSMNKRETDLSTCLLHFIRLVVVVWLSLGRPLVNLLQMVKRTILVVPSNSRGESVIRL